MATKHKRSKSRRASRQKKNSLVPWLIGLGALVLIAVPITINVVRTVNLPGERFASQGNAHIPISAPMPDYNSSPPTSGPHYERLAAWGSHTELVPLEHLVHNMEDAGVVLWYQYGTPEENLARVAALEEAYDSSRYRRVVIAPYEGLATTYAMSAWQRLATFNKIDSEKINAFMEAYEGIDHHPQ